MPESGPALGRQPRHNQGRVIAAASTGPQAPAQHRPSSPSGPQAPTAAPHLQPVLALTEPAVGPGGPAPVLHGLEAPREGDAAAPQHLRDLGAVHLLVHLAGLPEAVLRLDPAGGSAVRATQDGARWGSRGQSRAPWSAGRSAGQHSEGLPHPPQGPRPSHSEPEEARGRGQWDETAVTGLEGGAWALAPDACLQVEVGAGQGPDQTRLHSLEDLPGRKLLLAPVAQVHPEGHHGRPGPLCRQPPGFLRSQRCPAGATEQRGRSDRAHRGRHSHRLSLPACRPAGSREHEAVRSPAPTVQGVARELALDLGPRPGAGCPCLRLRPPLPPEAQVLAGAPRPDAHLGCHQGARAA